jgi:hypothetical protein
MEFLCTCFPAQGEEDVPKVAGEERTVTKEVVHAVELEVETEPGSEPAPPLSEPEIFAKADPDPNVRDVTLPCGRLGLIFQPGCNQIMQVGSETSRSLVGKIQVGEKVVALVRPGVEGKLDCTAMTDTQIVAELLACKDQPGRVLCVA